MLLLISCKKETPNKIVLKNANIINVLNGQVITNSLLIENTRIKEIGRYKTFNTDSSITIIDCTGKYIIPGLFDMHTHLLEHKNSTKHLDSLLKLGITSVRDMGGHADSLAQLKLNIDKGLISSPDVYFAGYTLDGIKDREKEDPTTWIITDTTNLNKVVTKLKYYGVDFLKVHSYFPDNRLEELISISSENNLSVVGHIPRHIDPITAVKLGLTSVEHSNSIIESLVTAQNNDVENITTAFAALDSTYLDNFANAFKEYNSAFTPTLHIINKIYQANLDENMRRLGKLMMDRFLKLTYTLNENGVLLLAGSDDVPIDETNLTSLHKELQWLVKAGLTPVEAIQAATINPAKFLKINSDYGSIEVNKKADLIILNGNPLDDISNTLDISRTLKNGKFVN